MGELNVWCVISVAIFSVVFASSSNNEAIPNVSDAGVAGSCSPGKVCGENEEYLAVDARKHGKWNPFRITSEEKWISFDSVVEKYIDWHKQALNDLNVPCSEKKVLVFTPSAGLGDSIGALTAAFMYSLRTGRLFFIDWKPFPWSVTFKDLPFFYNYGKACLLKNELTGERLMCPESSDKTSFISGHVTSEHPVVKEAKGYEFHTDYDKMIHFFMKPSGKVQDLLDDVTRQYFKNDQHDVLLQKVAIVMRTGIGEYNQFLSIGDEISFVNCFINYAHDFKKKMSGMRVKFAIFVTSDSDEAKRNAVEALRNEAEKREIDITDVVTLKDSAVHVMHMTREDSKLKSVRDKLRKTVAEFFLIALCDARFLTHGSLFGRSAAELASGTEGNNFFISDSQCDGQRDKYSYLDCHVPKYPPVCGFDR